MNLKTRSILSKKISFKSFTDHREYHIQAINFKITNRDLVNQVMEYFPNFTGWIMVSGYKIKFKNGKIHANHNEPAISKGNKNTRIFVKHGVVQNYRMHDVTLFDIFGFRCNLETSNITMDDLFNNSGFLYLDDFIMTLSYSKDAPSFTNDSENYWHFYKNDQRMYSHIYVDAFMKRNNLTQLSDDDISIFKFERELDEK